MSLSLHLEHCYTNKPITLPYQGHKRPMDGTRIFWWTEFLTFDHLLTEEYKKWSRMCFSILLFWVVPCEKWCALGVWSYSIWGKQNDFPEHRRLPEKVATEKKALYGAAVDVSLRLPLLAEAGTGRWNGAVWTSRLRGRPCTVWGCADWIPHPGGQRSNGRQESWPGAVAVWAGLSPRDNRWKNRGRICTCCSYCFLLHLITYSILCHLESGHKELQKHQY